MFNRISSAVFGFIYPDAHLELKEKVEAFEKANYYSSSDKIDEHGSRIYSEKLLDASAELSVLKARNGRLEMEMARMARIATSVDFNAESNLARNLRANVYELKQQLIAANLTIKDQRFKLKEMGEKFEVYKGLKQNTVFTKNEIKTLIFLCHPDKHNGSKSANEITSKLLGAR